MKATNVALRFATIRDIQPFVANFLSWFAAGMACRWPARHGLLAGMGRFISRWLVMTIAAGVMVALLPGMNAIGDPPVLGIAAFALFMALINASIKPIVQLLALPFSVLTLGITALVINWLFMELASWLAVSIFGVGVTIDGFWWSVIGSLIMAIVSGIVGTVIGD